MSVSFNLVDEPWLPVVWLDGRAEEVGLRDALVRADEIRELVDGSPLVTVSLHRLLLAILHRNFGPETFDAWKDLWRRGQWDATRLDAYFAQWRHRFDLFDADRPFYQVAQMADGGPEHSAAFLAHERAGSSESTIALFDHTLSPRRDPMPAGVAARYLVARQAYSLALGKSSPFYLTGTPLLSGYVVLALGRTLFETLALNLTEYGAASVIVPTPDDLPVWEQETLAVPDWNGTAPRGPLDYFTWQSRRIRLITDGVTPIVRASFLAQGLKFTEGTLDSQKPYSRSEEKGWTARFLDSDRALWRDSHAILQHDGNQHVRRPEVFNQLARIDEAREDGDIKAERGYEIAIVGLGMEKGKAANVLLWRHERFTVPLAYLHVPELLGRLEDALMLAEHVGQLLRAGRTDIIVNDKKISVSRPFQVLAEALLPSVGGKADRKRVDALVEHLAPERGYWSRLEVPFRQLLAALPDDQNPATGAYGERQLPDWAATLNSAAWDAFREATSGLDQSARSLKAVAKAERELRTRLHATLGEYLALRKGVTT